MPEEKADNIQQEKPLPSTSQESGQQGTPPPIKRVDLSESAIKNAGDQGISLKPVGSHDTNPFGSQDAGQANPPAQPSTPPPSSSDTVAPSTSTQSSSGESSASGGGSDSE